MTDPPGLAANERTLRVAVAHTIRRLQGGPLCRNCGHTIHTHSGAAGRCLPCSRARVLKVCYSFVDSGFRSPRAGPMPKWIGAA